MHGDASCVLALRRRCTLCMGALNCAVVFRTRLRFGRVCIVIHVFWVWHEVLSFIQCFIYNASMSCERVLKKKDVAFEWTH